MPLFAEGWAVRTSHNLGVECIPPLADEALRAATRSSSHRRAIRIPKLSDLWAHPLGLRQSAPPSTLGYQSQVVHIRNLHPLPNAVFLLGTDNEA